MAPDTLTDGTSAPPSLGRRLLAPGLTLAAVAGATCFVAVFDPNAGGPYPLCPSQMLGIDCPGCGGLRATHALTQGDVLAAADNNLLYVLLIPVLAVLFVLWVRRSWRGVPPRDLSPRTRTVVMVSLIGLVATFTIARNFVGYLGAGIG